MSFKKFEYASLHIYKITKTSKSRKTLKVTISIFRYTIIFFISSLCTLQKGKLVRNYFNKKEFIVRILNMIIAFANVAKFCETKFSYVAIKNDNKIIAFNGS